MLTETQKDEKEKGAKKMAKDIKVEEVLTETQKDEKEAIETAKKVKESLVRIKVPVDPQNPKDLMVPVMINGYMWNIKRGETVEVPDEVARILEEAKYI